MSYDHSRAWEKAEPQPYNGPLYNEPIPHRTVTIPCSTCGVEAFYSELLDKWLHFSPKPEMHKVTAPAVPDHRDVLANAAAADEWANRERNAR
jgi:hypothetical protein